MLFNSLEYALFLPVVFLAYWLIGNKNIKFQNILILLSSYVFYGFWDWRFLFLIFLSSIIDFYVGLGIASTSNYSRKKWYLYLSIFWNLGILFIFKYFNFFIDNSSFLLNLDEQSHAYSSLNIILPVGLSFYTFQTISYTIDVYKERIKPTHQLLEFLCFVSFFPQLVAGPVERARFLLPQFFRNRSFSLPLAKEGLRQILWGLFKKVVVADNLALAVNQIFANPHEFQSAELFYATTLFYFQLYCDFSGYVDIAIGSAKLLGFKLSVNFKLPHFAVSIPDLWRRWNITVGTWFRDYVHIPFLKNKKRTLFTNSVALLLTFTLIGFWHGASWTFVVFGFLHSSYMIIDRFKSILIKKKLFPKFKGTLFTLIAIFLTFTLTVLTLIFFRSPNLTVAMEILNRICLFIPDQDFKLLIGLNILFLPLLILLELWFRKKEFPFQDLEHSLPRFWRWAVYYIFIYFIIRYGGPKESFIYFQF